MNTEFQLQLPQDFHPGSRVWIYQSSRLFSPAESTEIEILLKDFVQNWKTHGTPVKGFGTLHAGMFILLMADESEEGVSGCSTDQSVRLIKEIENRYHINLFDRQSLAFIIDGQLNQLPLSQLDDAIESKKIHSDTLYFNNTVLSKKELEENWIIPLKNSWLKNKLALQII